MPFGIPLQETPPHALWGRFLPAPHTPSAPEALQVLSHLRAHALALLSAWNALPSDSSISLYWDLYSNVSFSAMPSLTPHFRTPPMSPPTFHAFLPTLAFPTSLMYLISYLFLFFFFLIHMYPMHMTSPRAGNDSIWSWNYMQDCVGTFLMKSLQLSLDSQVAPQGKGPMSPPASTTSHHHSWPWERGILWKSPFSFRKKTLRVETRDEEGLILSECSNVLGIAPDILQMLFHLILTTIHWNVYCCPIS